MAIQRGPDPDVTRVVDVSMQIRLQLLACTIASVMRCFLFRRARVGSAVADRLCRREEKKKGRQFTDGGANETCTMQGRDGTFPFTQKMSSLDTLYLSSVSIYPRHIK
ncbi:hypothetical protein BU24DRAFT_130282 [Aaosphaeria arxii CBS 175.79]|uniref:Uncharacterized protein n=1 Tax=Aaosphaeria arxii CBS 175.79 TaxID=1450172 RepID=A0A6A5Y529_9PLEO|nr:uncharacterized protein BU24DRAFT_130282 [Aaosphaeria arxii CBS 175.79]KAF2019951.1 hypothetical protein BU24DRAFT_130282 [Aaosphaeria arxii CBS 175.79]